MCGGARGSAPGRKVSMHTMWPTEGDIVAGEADEPVVGDGDAMGVTAQIVEHVPGVAERRLRVDHPLRLCCGRKKGGERRCVGERFKLAVEVVAASTALTSAACKSTRQLPRPFSMRLNRQALRLPYVRLSVSKPITTPRSRSGA